MSGPIRILAREKQCVGAGDCVSRPMTEEEMRKYYTKEEIEEMAKKIEPPAKEKLLETLTGIRGKTKAVYAAAKAYKVSASVVFGWIKDYDIKFDVAGYVVREPEEVMLVHESTPLTVEIGGKMITHDGEKLIQTATEQLDKEMERLSEVKIPKPTIDDEGTITFQEADEVVISGIQSIEEPSEQEKEIQSIEKAINKTVNLINKILQDSGTITITGQETKEITKRLGYAEHDIGNATVIYDFRADLVKITTPDDNEMTPEVARAVAEDILDILGHE